MNTENLVQNEIYCNISMLVSRLAELDEDLVLDLLCRTDFETPGREYLECTDYVDDLEEAAGSDWDEILTACGVPDTVQHSTHWVCSDCLMVLANGDYTGIEGEARMREVEAGVEDFPTDVYYNDDDDEFSRRPCDCCGTPLAGRRHGCSDGTDEDDDVEVRIKHVDAFESVRSEILKRIKDWQHICHIFKLEPHYDEVYEHWAVSRWLGRRLEAKDEVVGDLDGLTIWGRCTTGQAIHMDCVINEIFEEMK
jgi:hypothetical protein